MINTCGECRQYTSWGSTGNGACALSLFGKTVNANTKACTDFESFERRLTMEKQPTENITIPVWRYDLLVKAETMLELAKKIHRNSDEYEAKKNLMIVFDADEEPCETI